MSQMKPTYAELERRCRQAESALAAIRSEQADVVIGEQGMLVVRLREAEKALQEAEHKYRTLFEVFPLGITVASPDGQILETNRIAEELLGISTEQQNQRQINDAEWRMIRPDGTSMPAEEAASVRALSEGRKVENVEMGLLKPDGKIIWLNVTAAPILLDGYGVVVAYVDITARKRMEEELRRSNSELEQFAYATSHDLQEPLRTMTGMVQLLQQRYQGQLDEQASDYIRYAVDASERMQQLINGLLDFSRVDRKVQPFKPTEMGQVLQAALLNLHAAIAESGAQITSDPLPVVRADAGQLTQVLQNLIGNAIKFRSQRPLKIHIGAEKIANGWQFAVQDNGIGIDPRYFERVFQIFQRLHTRQEYPGSGIGLALCKKIIERHGGKIWIQSAVDRGATFYFTIPDRQP